MVSTPLESQLHRHWGLAVACVGLLLLAACSNPNPTCESRAGACWELSISGTGTDIDVGQEKAFLLYSSLYNAGEVIYKSARVNPTNVDFSVGRPNVLRVEVRTNEFGGSTAYMIGLAPGETSLAARLKDDSRARAEVIMRVN
mgnify:FL=1